jgi:hypothetical protein
MAKLRSDGRGVAEWAKTGKKGNTGGLMKQTGRMLIKESLSYQSMGAYFSPKNDT